MDDGEAARRHRAISGGLTALAVRLADRLAAASPDRNLVFSQRSLSPPPARPAAPSTRSSLCSVRRRATTWRRSWAAWPRRRSPTGARVPRAAPRVRVRRLVRHRAPVQARLPRRRRRRVQRRGHRRRLQEQVGGSEEADQRVGAAGDGEAHHRRPTAGIRRPDHRRRARQRHLLQGQMRSSLQGERHGEEAVLPRRRRRRRRRRAVHVEPFLPARHRARRLQGAQAPVQIAATPRQAQARRRRCRRRIHAVRHGHLPPRRARRAAWPRGEDGVAAGVPARAHAGERGAGRRVPGAQVQGVLRRQRRRRPRAAGAPAAVLPGARRPVRHGVGRRLRLAVVRRRCATQGGDGGERGRNCGCGRHHDMDASFRCTAAAGGLRRRPSVRVLHSGDVKCGCLRRTS